MRVEKLPGRWRPKRSARDIVRHINQRLLTKEVNYMLEANIKGFFDNIDHDWLMKYLEHDIQDKNFLRYIKRYLFSGIMEEADRKYSSKGLADQTDGAETLKLLAAVIRGQCNYYGVNENFHAIQSFWKYLKYSTCRMLNVRDQKG